MLLAEMPITIYVYIDRNVQNLKKPGCGHIIVHYHLGAPVGANKEENDTKADKADKDNMKTNAT